MKDITLGSTGITVPQNGFGALPIQRVPLPEAVKILRKAYDGGTAHKIGVAREIVESGLYETLQSQHIFPFHFPRFPLYSKTRNVHFLVSCAPP